MNRVSHAIDRVEATVDEPIAIADACEDHSASVMLGLGIERLVTTSDSSVSGIRCGTQRRVGVLSQIRGFGLGMAEATYFGVRAIATRQIFG